MSVPVVSVPKGTKKFCVSVSEYWFFSKYLWDLYLWAKAFTRAVSVSVYLFKAIVWGAVAVSGSGGGGQRWRANKKLGAQLAFKT